MSEAKIRLYKFLVKMCRITTEEYKAATGEIYEQH